MKKSELQQIIREEVQNTMNEGKLMNNPNASLKGKTIESFKSNGRNAGYTVTFTDGTSILITGGLSGIPGNVYIERMN